MDLVAQAFSALRWNVVIRLSGQVLSWGMTIVVMRLLTPSDYGLLAMCTTLLLALSTLADFGIGAAIVQTPEIDDDKLRKMFGMALLANAVVALLVFASGPVVAQFYAEPALTAVLRVLSLQFIMNAFLAAPRAILQRKLDFRTLALVEFGSTIVGGLLTLGLAAAGKGVWALVLGNLCNLTLQVAALNIVCPPVRLPSFSLTSTGNMLSFGANVTGVGLLWSLWSQSDSLIAGKMLGSELLGAYAIGIHLTSIPASRFSQIVSQVAFSTFSRLQRDPAGVQWYLKRSLVFISVISFPVFWGLSCVAPEVIALTIGSRWSDAVFPIAMMGLIMPFRLIAQFMSITVRSLGRADVEFRSILVTTLVMPLAFYVGCRSGGLLGLSAVWITAYPCVLLWNFSRMFRALGVGPSSLLHVVSAPATAATVMFTALAVLRWSVQGQLNSVSRVALLIASGAVIYLTSLWILDRSTVLSVTQTLFRSLFPSSGRIDKSSLSA